MLVDQSWWDDGGESRRFSHVSQAGVQDIPVFRDDVSVLWTTVVALSGSGAALYFYLVVVLFIKCNAKTYASASANCFVSVLFFFPACGFIVRGEFSGGFSALFPVLMTYAKHNDEKIMLSSEKKLFID